MKVAMWSGTEPGCGIASHAAALVEALRRLDVAVEMVPVPYENRDADVRRETLARLNAADLVHLQHDYPFFGGIAPGECTLPHYLRELRRPHVVTAHTVRSAAEMLGVEQETRWRQRLARRLLASSPRFRLAVEVQPFEQAAALIAPSQTTRSLLIRRGLSASRIHVIRSPFPPEAPVSPETSASIRMRFRLDEGRILTMLGPLTPEIGCELALDAIRSLPPPVRLVLEGAIPEPDYRSRLQERIRAGGLAGRVTLTGPLEPPDRSALVEFSELILVPTDAANNRDAMIRALTRGRPVIAADLPEFRELVTEAPVMELFDAGDETMLAERIGRLLASPSQRNLLATAALDYARNRTGAEEARQTLSLYRRVLEHD